MQLIKIDRCSMYFFFINNHLILEMQQSGGPSRMLLKEGSGNPERGTRLWERALSGIHHSKSKWRTKKSIVNHRNSKVHLLSQPVRFQRSSQLYLTVICRKCLLVEAVGMYVFRL